MVLLFATWILKAEGLIAQEPDVPADQAPQGSPLVKEPTTPTEFMDAVLFTMKIARPEAAKGYIEALLALEPDDATLLSFREKYGTGTFLQLARTEGVNPPATVLLEQLMAAGSRQANDPAYLDRVIKNLAGNAREVDLAMRDLQHLGAPAAARLVKSAADENSGIDREQALIALTRMGTSAIAPLAGYLTLGNDAEKGVAANAFGFMASKKEAHHLYPLAFGPVGPGLQVTSRGALARILYGDPEQAYRLEGFGAAAKMRSTAEALLSGKQTIEPEDDGLVPVWVADNSNAGLKEARVSPRSAAVFQAEQLARHALTMAPGDKRTQALLLTTLLTRDAETAGWDQPLPQGPETAFSSAVAVGPSPCLEALALSNELGSVGASEALVRALAENGSATLLRTDARRGLVVTMLDHASPRVQFAAAETILTWDPQRRFSGSNRVVEILTSALEADAQPDGVVIDPNNSRASAMASHLNEMGYATHIVPTGAEGFTTAASRADIEVAVLHLNTIRWDLSPTIDNFRADSRTKHLPIAIYGPAGMQSAVAHLLKRDPLLTYVEESVQSSDLARQLKPLLAQVTPPDLTGEQRARQSKTAAAWLRRIAEGRTHIYDLTPSEAALTRAMGRTEIGEDTMIALAAIPTNSVQVKLADAAMNSGDSIPTRTAAARLLSRHLRQHQSALPETTGKALFDAWTQEADPGLKSALAGVVGAQTPQPGGIDTLLLNVPPSAAPAP